MSRARTASMDACAASSMDAITTSPAGMHPARASTRRTRSPRNPRDLGADVVRLLEKDGVRVAQLPEELREGRQSVVILVGGAEVVIIVLGHRR